MMDEHLVHLILKCDKCPWSTQDYIGGKDKSQRHAEETGHTVSGEAGYSVTIGE